MFVRLLLQLYDGIHVVYRSLLQLRQNPCCLHVVITTMTASMLFTCRYYNYDRIHVVYRSLLQLRHNPCCLQVVITTTTESMFFIGRYYNYDRIHVVYMSLLQLRQHPCCLQVVITTTTESMLFTGRYYNYDSSTNSHHDSIHADQLAGYWFLKASGIPDDTVSSVSGGNIFYYVCLVPEKLV